MSNLELGGVDTSSVLEESESALNIGDVTIIRRKISSKVRFEILSNHAFLDMLGT